MKPLDNFFVSVKQKINNNIFFRSVFSRKIAYAFLGITAGVAVISFMYHSFLYRTQISEFDMKASIADDEGIAPNSHFLIKTTASLTPQVLEKYIKVLPATEISVERVLGTANTFEIVPKTQLKTEQLYTVEINKGPLASHDFSWAYQVKSQFSLISSLPREKGVDVPLNTGIELYFNRDNINDPEKFIEITPKVLGNFEVKENRVRFIPQDALLEKTIYTLKIKAGLGAKDTKDTLDKDIVLSFQTSQGGLYGVNEKDWAIFSRQFSEFVPVSAVTFSLYGANVETASTTIYRFDTTKDFIDSVAKLQNNTPWAHFYPSKDSAIPGGKQIFTGVLPVENQEKDSFATLRTLRFPQTLETGYYAVVMTTGGGTDISWFQVNAVTSFAAFANSQSLLWFKDSSSTESKANVLISYDGTQIGKSEADGVALFATPKELTQDNGYDYAIERKFFVAKIPTGDLVIPFEDEYGYKATLYKNNYWWNYISLNKNIYLPTDTVHFWAIEKPRNSEMAEGEMSVKLTTPFWDEKQENIVTYAETKVTPSEYSALTGELSFANLKPGIYDLTFRKGMEIVAKQTLTVGIYVKPAYSISATPDKNTIFAGDSLTFKVKATFFDGTPVANTTVSYASYVPFGKNTNGEITLNSQGEGSFIVSTTYKDDETYWPSYLSVNVRPKYAEEGQIETNSSVFVFGPHLKNVITQKQTAKNVDFTIKTRAIILGKSIREEPYWDVEQYLGDSLPSMVTKVAVSEVVYLKEKTGTGYDPINKVTYPIYYYHSEDHLFSTETVTSDQNGVSQLSFTPQDKKTYKYVFTTLDSYGRQIKDTRYVYGGGYDTDYYGSNNSSYYLNNSEASNKVYKIGDTINLTLQNSQGLMPPVKKESYLFMTINNGTIEYSVQDTPNFVSSFRNKDIPNIAIWPGWFSGGRFHNSYLQNISFDASVKRLTISVVNDKKKYAPGDTVNLDIKVTDKNNVGVKAEVNLSAQDEAIFSLRPEERDIINDLYQDIYSQVVIRTSNMPPYGGGGAEKGGGGDDVPRSNFKEITLFKSVMTDETGHAHVSFKLPDNITSWRLTTQAVTKELYAGKDIHFIPVSLPFFVDTTLNATYLAYDNLVVRLRVFGESLGKSPVNYSIESPTLAFKKLEKVGTSSIDVPLGSLTLGTHELTVRANSDGKKDAITLPLKVLSSYFTKNASDFYEGANGLSIKNKSEGYTTISFSSYGKGKIYTALQNLACDCGIRVDQKGSEVIAVNILNKYFGQKIEKPEFNATKYQSYTGGIRLLPYSSDDLELSAMTAHLFDVGVFDRSSLNNYFSIALADTKSDTSRKILAYYGLSASKYPVLTKIQKIKNEKKLTVKDRIYIALTLNALGAKEEARSYYRKEIVPHLEMKSTYAYIGGLKGDETITMTTLVAGLSASLEEKETSLLALYIEQSHTKETLNSFEKLLYIQALLPKLDKEEINFTYKVGTKQESKIIKDGESFNLTLSPSELSSFSLLGVKGKLGLSTSYEMYSSPSSIVKDSNLSLSRTYEVNGSSTKVFGESDLVKVILLPKFSENALGGSYQIVDYLPSGLRPIDQESNRHYDSYDNHVYPNEITNQKITFMVEKEVTLPVYYYARVVSKGTYKAESALLQSLKSLDSVTISNEDSIVVK